MRLGWGMPPALVVADRGPPGSGDKRLWRGGAGGWRCGCPGRGSGRGSRGSGVWWPAGERLVVFPAAPTAGPSGVLGTDLGEAAPDLVRGGQPRVRRAAGGAVAIWLRQREGRMAARRRLSWRWVWGCHDGAWCRGGFAGRVRGGWRLAVASGVECLAAVGGDWLW